MSAKNTLALKALRRLSRTQRKERSPVPYATEAMVWDKQGRPFSQYMSTQTGRELLIPKKDKKTLKVELVVSPAKRFKRRGPRA